MKSLNQEILNQNKKVEGINAMLHWAFLNQHGKFRQSGDLESPQDAVAVGQKVKLQIRESYYIRHYGLRAWQSIEKALIYGKSPVLCLVELDGDIDDDVEGSYASELTVLAMADVRNVLREFTLRCVEQSILTIEDPLPLIRNVLSLEQKAIGDDEEHLRAAKTKADSATNALKALSEAAGMWSETYRGNYVSSFAKIVCEVADAASESAVINADGDFERVWDKVYNQVKETLFAELTKRIMEMPEFSAWDNLVANTQ